MPGLTTLLRMPCAPRASPRGRLVAIDGGDMGTGPGET